MAATLIPTVSRVLPDGTLVDLIHDDIDRTTCLAVRSPAGDVAIVDQWILPDGDVLVPYAPTNNLLSSGCIALPSGIANFGSKTELLDDLKAFIHRYVGFTPLFEDIAAHYVLLSWVYDAFNEVPYLRFSGDYGSGKTRALLVLGLLVYKGFFASGASTVSPIFHVLDAFRGTLLLDEADLRFSDATADLTKILNNGTMRGLPVLRTMANRHRELNPQAFCVFGPKVIAMRARFQDEALESRFLTETMEAGAMRPDIPISAPDGMKLEAQRLRARLLAWRFATRGGVSIRPATAIDSLSARSNQMALPILSLVDDEGLRSAISDWFIKREGEFAAVRGASQSAVVVRVLDGLFRGRPYVPVAAVAEALNQARETPLPTKSVGSIIRRDLGLVTTKTRGVYVVPASERAKVTQLVERYLPSGRQP